MGVRVQVAVIGDISVESKWRNRGFGQVLLRYLTEYLQTYYPRSPALVIPTESARRALERVGWTAAGTLVPSVYVLDPSRHAVYRKALDRQLELYDAVVRKK